MSAVSVAMSFQKGSDQRHEFVSVDQLRSSIEKVNVAKSNQRCHINNVDAAKPSDRRKR